MCIRDRREILDHPFLTSNPIPTVMPNSTLSTAPPSSWIKQLTTPKGSTRTVVSFTPKLGEMAPSTDGRFRTAYGSNYLGVISPTHPTSGFENHQSETYKLLTHDLRLTVNTKKIPIGRSFDEAVYVAHWKDFSAKFGLGYKLTNGSVGTCFNDSSKMILSPRNNYFEYYERGAEKLEIVSKHTVSDSPPPELSKKYSILQSFKASFDKLEEDHVNRTQNEFNSPTFEEHHYLIYVKKWMKTKHALLFRLNNKLVQVVFLDNTQIIISSTHKMVMYINKKGEKEKLGIVQAMESTNVEMVKRLKYAKEILMMIVNKQRPEEKHTPTNNNKAPGSTDQERWTRPTPGTEEEQKA
eukprot:TRINITY_DN4512_c0_g2_i2.p1 TRINITY_DN4512_c0_g2~~TRINITY_DN4512_c0_g2_i2.p1  ORF type:complete len:353 (+),score=86.55 TRINITY_DN4512_c0_g2_i2:64-1122(+)